MAKNTGEGHRSGVVTNRTQTYNPKTEKFVKRDVTTGKFLSCKDKPFKNIRKETGLKEDSKLKEDAKLKANKDKKQKVTAKPKAKPKVKAKK
jgi:hypothetical protein